MKQLYVIRDLVAQDLVSLRMYTVMTFKTHEEAARYFADAVNDTTSILNKHAKDYALVFVGEINDDGDIFVKGPEQLVTGDMVLAIQKPALVANE